jgi:hypothetical protein
VPELIESCIDEESEDDGNDGAEQFEVDFEPVFEVGGGGDALDSAVAADKDVGRLVFNLLIPSLLACSKHNVLSKEANLIIASMPLA